MAGKPTIRGTRITVDHLLMLFAAGWSQEKVLEGYPHLTADDLSAVFSYAAECIDGQRLVTFNSEIA
jgi:uncharacterized protein (DUF433 family)